MCDSYQLWPVPLNQIEFEYIAKIFAFKYKFNMTIFLKNYYVGEIHYKNVLISNEYLK